jgi:hypothetical protein
MTNKKLILQDFMSCGVGLQEPLHANVYCHHPFADYNSAGTLQKTTHAAWRLFARYIILSSIFIVAAHGK